jgi:hypothetical protein
MLIACIAGRSAGTGIGARATGQPGGARRPDRRPARAGTPSCASSLRPASQGSQTGPLCRQQGPEARWRARATRSSAARSGPAARAHPLGRRSHLASCVLGRLSQLGVWRLRPGNRPELIEPAPPQQNGPHERMRRDLTADITRPPAASFGAHQRRFDTFRRSFNEARPHAPLWQRRPAARNTPSDRLFVPSFSRSPILSTLRSAACPPTAAFGGTSAGTTFRTSSPRSQRASSH